jgi:hypothetical protein
MLGERRNVSLRPFIHEPNGPSSSNETLRITKPL